jgi:hypothetical protein
MFYSAKLEDDLNNEMKGSGRQRLKSSAEDQFGIWMEVFKKTTKIHAMTTGLWACIPKRDPQA